MLKNSATLAVLLAFGLMAGTGCSVKEDRVPCPAYLSVSFAGRESISRPVGLLGYSTLELFREDVEVEKHDPCWVKAVRKGEFALSAYYGVELATAADHYVVVPVGSECDSLYAYHTVVDCTGDMACAEVALHKQFCTVHLDLNKPLAGSNAITNYSFLVEGNTCGFDLLDFQPVMGTYRIEPRAAGGKRVVDFRVPRQADDSMTVTIRYSSPEVATPLLLGVFPLGEYIGRLGYRWDTEDLQDIYVVIDAITGLVTISVEGWEEGYTFTFIEQ